MFLRNDQGADLGGSAAALSFGRAAAIAAPAPSPLQLLLERLQGVDWTPDLGSQIGTRSWWRGAATCAALCAGTIALAPGISRPVIAGTAPAMIGADYDETRSLAIAPLAFGATSGHRLGATALVAELSDTPERPTIEATATVGANEDFEAALRRAGVSLADADTASDLVGDKISLDDLRPGTQLEITLGRRAEKDAPRQLEKVAFRARFDLGMEVERTGNGLAAIAHPIAVDNTPLRIQGRAGSSLYRSARAAGVPAKAVEAFIRSVASRMPIGKVSPDDEFDIIVEQARAATGEVQLGKLLYAGLDGSTNKLQLMRWQEDGKDQWFDPKGVGPGTQSQAGFPVNGRLTSGFGARRHPVLGYVRMHKGLDIAAPYGAPIRAAKSGRVEIAGWHGGHGNYVKLGHGSGMETGYGHMSRIAVRPGSYVNAGQVIGYVGSTGLSTGPHLHYELWKNGVAVNPGKVTFESVQRLQGGTLAAFKSKLAKLLSLDSN